MLPSILLIWAFTCSLPLVTGRHSSTAHPEETLSVPLDGNPWKPPEVIEGSGRGLDITGFYDDEDDDNLASYDDDDDFYDDSDSDYGDADYSTQSTNAEVNPTNSGNMKNITCFRCLGDGVTGCDVSTMLKDIHKFTVTCVRQCLNISAGSISVYDCARDLAIDDNMCLDEFNSMCFCDTDMCNGPVSSIPPAGSSSSNNDQSSNNYFPRSHLAVPNEGGDRIGATKSTIDTRDNHDKMHLEDKEKSQITGYENNNKLHTSSYLSESLHSKPDNNDFDLKTSNVVSSGVSLSSRTDRTDGTNTHKVIPLESSNTGSIRDKDQRSPATSRNVIFPDFVIREVEIDIVVPERRRPDTEIVDKVDDTINNNNSSSSASDRISGGRGVHSLSAASQQDGGRRGNNGQTLKYSLSVNVMVLILMCLHVTLWKQ